MDAVLWVGPGGRGAGRQHASRDFREALIAAGALEALFARLDRAINGEQPNAMGPREAVHGYLPRGGQIVDATLVAAPRRRNTDAEKAAIKDGRTAAEIWPDRPAKARQKDVDGRWTVRHSKAKVQADGSKPIDIAIPVYGYKSPVSIDRMHGIVRRQVVTDAARHDGARLREGLIDRRNTARDVRADSAYRSAGNEAWLTDHGMTSRIHRKKPRGRAMPERTSQANAAKSVLRSKVEHVFAHQKARMRVTIRTIGIARAKAAITLANMACNMTRWRWLKGRAAPA